MLRTHLSLFSLLCLALSAAASGSDTPAQPQPAAIAHRGHAKPNPFFRRQATRDQIVQRRQAHSQAQVDSGVLPLAEEATLGKQRLSERDSGPSPSPKAGETYVSGYAASICHQSLIQETLADLAALNSTSHTLAAAQVPIRNSP